MLIDKMLKYLRKTGLDPSHNYDFPFFRFDKATDEDLTKMYHQQVHGTESDRPAPRNWELPQGNPCRDWHMPFDNMLVELGAQGRESAGASCCVFETVTERNKAEGDVPGDLYFVLGVAMNSSRRDEDGLLQAFDVFLVGGSLSVNSSHEPQSIDSAVNIKQQKASLIDSKTGLHIDLDLDNEIIKNTFADDEVFECTDGEIRSYNQMVAEDGDVQPVESQAQTFFIIGLKFLFVMELLRSILAILWVQRPTHFIVEERPTRWEKKPPKKNTVINSTKKPHFICIAPERIRTTYIKDPDSSPTGRKTRAHQRRGHWRTYSNERYRNLKGKRQWIDAIWVGPQEAVVGKNKYIVRLDK
jgi:hypothetical protein